MCLLPENEQFAAVDDTAEWGCTHLRQPSRDNVIPMPTKPVHELHRHVAPEAGNTTGSKARDFVVMWLMGIDWFWSITTIVAFVAGVLTILGGMLALASVVDPDDLEHVLSVIGGAL